MEGVFLLNEQKRLKKVGELMKKVATADRESYFDNAKFMLILLVVFGHFMQPYIGDNLLLEDLYYFVFTFHMPAFVLISGYFTKGFRRAGYLKKLLKSIVFPYIIFEIIYAGFYYLIDSSQALKIDLLNPEWSLWFLVSLFCWHLGLFIFTKLPASWSILLSFGISVAVGYIDSINHIMSLSRTFVFFPFFLVGHFLTKEHIRYVQEQCRKWWGIVLFFILATLIQQNDVMNKYWVFGSQPYDHFLDDPSFGWLVRIYIYCLSFMGILAFLILVPQKMFFFTKWGRNTIFTYLLHGFIVKGLRTTSLTDAHLTAPLFLGLVVLSLLTTVLLSSNLVSQLCRPLIGKKWRFALKNETE